MGGKTLRRDLFVFDQATCTVSLCSSTSAALSLLASQSTMIWCVSFEFHVAWLLEIKHVDKLY